ncbi:MAG: protein kinase [Myxococcales bacterium]|nr:protein kinase [Myxococcales bacterium]
MKLGDVIASRFEIHAFVGEGGMGNVYRALDRQTGELVALKRVPVTRDQEQQFYREARALSGLDHPAIVRYVAHGSISEGEHYLAMEWLEGETLRARLERGALPLEESIDLIRRAAGALSHAHARGIIHCDLSPGNLFLIRGDAGQLKLIDFGLSRHRGDRTETTIELVGAAGTMGYMAPEQARGAIDVDGRADLFSLGAILFECLSGRPAFGADDYLAVLAKIVVASAPPLSELLPGAPPLVEALLTQLLAKDPNDRPASAEQVIESLSGVGGSRPTLRAPLPGDTAAITERERELVSVIVARTQGVSGPLQPRVKEVAARTQLRAEALADGSFVLTSGGTGAATDQAARAATAALDLISSERTLALGVATGWATLAGGLAESAVVDRAAALSTTPGSIAIDDVTRGLLPTRFEVAGTRGAYVLVAIGQGEQPARRLLGRATPCVGRDRELRTLHAIIDESVSAPAAQVVLVTGAAGAGKSRVRYELLRELAERKPGLEVWLGRGDSLRAGAPFDILARALRAALALAEGAPLEVRRGILADRVARLGARDEGPRIAEFLGELLGVPFPESVALAAARDDALLMGDQLRRAFEDFLSLECQQHPILLVLEDFQWGDAATVKLVDGAMRNLPELPWTVMAVARPDVHVTFPGLWVDRNAQEVRIGALTRKAAERMVRESLGEVDDRTVTELTGRAAGNAFYLEELIRARVEGRRDALPDTVLGMVKERIESMEPEARRVLRAASVLGQSFTPSGIMALVGGETVANEIAEWLVTLEQREVVTRRGDPASSDGELTFRHALVRDAAYAMLTDQDRALGHRLAAEHLEQSGIGDGAILAEHFERAGLPERAAPFWAESAKAALDAGDFDAALARAERGLASGVTGSAAAGLELTRGEALRLAGKVSEALTVVERALAGFEHGSLGWCNACAERALILQRLGRSVELMQAAAELDAVRPRDGAADALSLARVRAALALLRIGERTRARSLVERAEQVASLMGPVTAAFAHGFRAVEALLDGNPARYLREARWAVSRHTEVGDVRMALEQSISIGSVQMELGAHAESERTLREALASAERLGLPRELAGAQHNLGLTLAHLGQFDEAIRLEQRALEAFRDRDQRLAGGAELALSMIHLLAGDAFRADRAASRALEVLRGAAPPLVPAALATLARCRLLLGDVAGALAASSEAYRWLGAEGSVEFGEQSIRRAHAEALAASGRAGEARDVVRDAMAVLGRDAAKLEDPGLSRAFLERVPDNVRLRSLAREWGIPEPERG